VLLDCARAVQGESWLACPEGPLAHHARDAGLMVFPIAARRPQMRTSVVDRALAAPRLLAHARELRGLVANLDPDATVAWGMRSGIASLAVGRAGCPVAFAHNDMLPGPLVAIAVRVAAGRAEVVIVPSHAVAVDLDPDARLAGRLQIVAPGVDLDRFVPVGEPAQPPEVLVVGALATWKRPELALQACALARRRAPEVRLRLVGAPAHPDDPTLQRLRDRASQPDLAGAVELAGEHRRPEVDLVRATCLLHCAESEPYGLVVAEALACGRPVIVPSSAGPAEIADAGCALLYPPGDAVAAARAIVDLVRDPRLAALKGQAGRRRAVQRLGAERAAGEFAAALAPLGRRGPGSAGAERLCLVTVSHNSESALQKLLCSARRHLPGAEVVVVDNGSTDQSVEVAKRHPGATVVALDDNVGFGGACNRGLREVSAPVAALVNPDVELVDGSLALVAAEAVRADRPRRLLAPLVLSADGSRQDTVHPVPASAPDLIRAIVSPAFAPPSALAPWKARSPRRVGWAVGCALVADIDTLGALGPFDESIFLYGEDLDLCLRAAWRGIEVWFWPAARVLHHRAHSSRRAFGSEPFELLARARHDVVSKRMGARRARLDDAAQMVTFGSRIGAKLALGRPVGRERRQLAALRRRRDA
jgi:GT2 family glycosyltransferase/glycosyltransferase involved in cell wall biosynthesis